MGLGEAMLRTLLLCLAVLPAVSALESEMVPPPAAPAIDEPIGVPDPGEMAAMDEQVAALRLGEEERRQRMESQRFLLAQASRARVENEERAAVSAINHALIGGLVGCLAALVSGFAVWRMSRRPAGRTVTMAEDDYTRMFGSDEVSTRAVTRRQAATGGTSQIVPASTATVPAKRPVTTTFIMASTGQRVSITRNR
jgi:hypothetical protein